MELQDGNREETNSRQDRSFVYPRGITGREHLSITAKVGFLERTRAFDTFLSRPECQLRISRLGRGQSSPISRRRSERPTRLITEDFLTDSPRKGRGGKSREF